MSERRAYEGRRNNKSESVRMTSEDEEEEKSLTMQNATTTTIQFLFPFLFSTNKLYTNFGDAEMENFFSSNKRLERGKFFTVSRTNERQTFTIKQIELHRSSICARQSKSTGSIVPGDIS